MTRHNKTWTEEEKEKLRELWGEYSIGHISKKLKRKESAIEVMAGKLRLGCRYKNYMSANQAGELLGVEGRVLIRWKDKGLKIKTKEGVERQRHLICIEDLTKFLKDNQDLWDSRKLELFALGQEPEWLKEKRRKDMKEPAKHGARWTKQEEGMLIAQYNAGKSKKEIAAMLGRSEMGVQRKVDKLKSSGKLDKKVIICPWIKEEINIMLEMEKQHKSDAEIAWALGREEIHIRDKRRRMREKGEYEGYKKFRKYARKEFLENWR